MADLRGREAAACAGLGPGGSGRGVCCEEVSRVSPPYLPAVGLPLPALPPHPFPAAFLSPSACHSLTGTVTEQDPGAFPEQAFPAILHFSSSLKDLDNSIGCTFPELFCRYLVKTLSKWEMLTT